MIFLPIHLFSYFPFGLSLLYANNEKGCRSYVCAFLLHSFLSLSHTLDSLTSHRLALSLTLSPCSLSWVFSLRWDTDAVSSGSSSSDSESGSASNSEAERERQERKEKKKAEKKAKKAAMTIKEPGMSPKRRKSPSKTTKKRKNKKETDPNKPKRPMTAYFLWFNGARDELKEKNPGLSITELSKKAGEVWRGMSAEDKKVKSQRNISHGLDA